MKLPLVWLTSRQLSIAE